MNWMIEINTNPDNSNRFSFSWEFELQEFYCRLVTRTEGRSMKSHGYFIHDYWRKLHAQLDRVNKRKTTSHKSYFTKGLLNYCLVHTKYDKAISEKIPIVNAGY